MVMMLVYIRFGLFQVYIDDAWDADVISPNGSLVTRQLADEYLKNIDSIKSTLQV